MCKCLTIFSGISVLLACVSGAQANVVVDTVFVGNAGNAGDPTVGGNFGGVAYTYDMGKFEITAWQYTDFLNAVADMDTYGLYNTDMWDSDYGCKIERGGSSGSYSYSVATDWADRPVNYVSWGDAARFCNWMHNGQPTGPQGLSTTEDGSYFLNGATTVLELIAVMRKAGATWVIPSENEWYKAAYHKNDGVTSNYFKYPTSNDTWPSNELDGGGNNATFFQDHHTIGSPYYRTEVGAHVNSESPYDTFDMGGNVWEWNEAVVSYVLRGLRGGAFDITGLNLHASIRSGCYPTNEYNQVGFRVAQVPEPATLSLLLVGSLLTIRRRRTVAD